MPKGMQIIGFKALTGSVAAKQCWRSIGDLQSRERPVGAQQSVKSCECLTLEIQRATKCTRASSHGEVINHRKPRL